jgi:hypothetical protein
MLSGVCMRVKRLCLAFPRDASLRLQMIEIASEFAFAVSDTFKMVWY